MTVRIGGWHNWHYHSNWREHKAEPGTWHFVSPQRKFRIGRQMRGYGCTPRGTTFHWNIRAHQHMTKIGRNQYRGRMFGVKRLVRRSC